MSYFFGRTADLLSVALFVLTALSVLKLALAHKADGSVGPRQMWSPVLTLFAFVSVSFLVISHRVGFCLTGAVGLGVFLTGTGVILWNLRRFPGTFALAQAFLAVLALGLVWNYRITAASQPSGWRSAIIITVAMIVLAAGASTTRLSDLVFRIRPAMLALTGLILLAAPVLTWHKTHGAFISVEIPLLGEIQTGDLGRFALIVWVARSVAKYQPLLLLAQSRLSKANIRLLTTITLPVLLGVCVSGASNDFGPMLVLAGATVAVVFAGGLGSRYLLWLGVLSAAGASFLVMTNDKVASRFAQFLQPIPVKGDLTQVGTGLTLLSDGPTGLTLGLPRLVPLSDSDMILAAIGHEMGLLALAAFLVLLASVLVALRVLYFHITDTRRRFAVAGVTASFLLQSILMMAAVLAAAPLTGMPVPFLAVSGSSLLTSGFALAFVASCRQEPNSAPSPLKMKRVTVLTGALALLVAACTVRLAVVGATSASIRDASGTRDVYKSRTSALALPTISTSDGVVIARTQAPGPHAARLANASRVYPKGSDYSALLGDAFRPGLEAKIAEPSPCIGLFGVKVDDCGTVQLTLNSKVQNAAVNAMRGKTGAVVAVNTQTGAIVAYVSTIEGVDTAAVVVTEAGRDRVRSERIAPGSTAKLLTAAAGLEANVAVDRPVTSSLQVPGGGTINAAHDVPCGGNLNDALASSCNPYFAAIGIDIGADRLSEATSGWLNGQKTLSGMPIANSALLGTTKDAANAAAGAIGLGDAQVTPLGMLQMTAQVARGGKPLCMFLLAGEQPECSEQRPMSAPTARTIAGAMREVVSMGTARDVRGLSILDAAAKTGTADVTELNNATFSAFAPSTDPKIAVVVFIEPGPQKRQGLTGAKDAGPVAQAVLAAALRTP